MTFTLPLALGRLSRRLRPAEPDWRAGVKQVVHDLEGLNRSTELDFLAIGEKLMGLRSAARRIAADMSALTELISGEHGRSASVALNRMLEQAEEMDGRVGRSGQVLSQIRDQAASIRLAFGGVRQTVSIFGTLCTLTRIETSRLGNSSAGFADLASEASPLSEMIRSRGEGVLESSAQLDLGVRSAIRCGAELRARQQAELPALIAQAREALQAFADRGQCAMKATAAQAARYEGLSEAIDRVVTSLQFHDITRQQVEHVMEGLQKLLAEPASSGAILTLQAAQLAATEATFHSSVEAMERDLESFAARVQEMAEASRALAGMSGDGRDSFFLQMENRFSAILGMLSACATTQTEMDSTVAGLEDTIRRMRASVEEINGIEVNIHRISINAALQATHIGAGGEPLNIIAEVMLRLALESNEKTAGAAASLDAMKQAVQSGTGDSEWAGVDKMKGALEEIQASSVSSFGKVHEIAALGDALAREIAPVRAEFSAGTLFSSVVNQARRELERIAGHDGSRSEEGDRALEALARNYTMQTERDVHNSVVFGSISESAPTSSGGDLGDNVELF